MFVGFQKRHKYSVAIISRSSIPWFCTPFLTKITLRSTDFWAIDLALTGVQFSGLPEPNQPGHSDSNLFQLCIYIYIIYIWKIWQGLWLNIIIIIAMLGVSLPPKVAHKQLQLLCLTNSLLIGQLNRHLWRWGLPIRSSCKSHRCNHLSVIYHSLLRLSFGQASLSWWLEGWSVWPSSHLHSFGFPPFFSTNGFWWPHPCQNQARLDRLLPYARGGDVQISGMGCLCWIEHKWTHSWAGHSLSWRGQWFEVALKRGLHMSAHFRGVGIDQWWLLISGPSDLGKTIKIREIKS